MKNILPKLASAAVSLENKYYENMKTWKVVLFVFLSKCETDMYAQKYHSAIWQVRFVGKISATASFCSHLNFKE